MIKSQYVSTIFKVAITNFKETIWIWNMVKSLKEILTDLGANVDQIVFEK